MTNYGPIAPDIVFRAFVGTARAHQVAEIFFGVAECITMSGDVRPHRAPVDVLNYEIVEEQAAALGRMGRALETALARLREFDAAQRLAGVPVSAQQARHALVREAGHALWMFVVQREACGLRDSRTVMRNYDVPGEVQLRMQPLFNRPFGERS